jgi:methionine-rich copper-binding protein CopC
VDKHPWLLPLALVAAGIKCILLYSGVLFVAFSAAGAVVGFNWLSMTIGGGILGLVLFLVVGYIHGRRSAAKGECESRSGWCPVPTRWFRRPPELKQARLLKTEPMPNSTLERSPRHLTLHFGSPIEPSLSGVTITDNQGNRVNATALPHDPQHPARLVVELPELVPGTYRVAWRSLAAGNGQSVGGNFSLSVAEAETVGVHAELSPSH